MEKLFTLLHWAGNILKAADLMPDFSSARGIFCMIAWVATLLAAGMVVVSFFLDFGDGGDVDAPDADGDAGVFSLRACIGFLLGFGWGGYMAVQAGMPAWGGVLVGLALGVIMFFVVVAVVRFIYSLKSDGSKDYDSNNMVGMTGTVYLSIPPAGESGGQVQISRAGSQLLTMPAIQHGSETLPAQTAIEVVSATPYQVVVRRLGTGQAS